MWTVLLAFVVMAVSGCATNVSERQALPKELFQIAGTKVVSGTRSNATESHLTKLESAVSAEVSKRNQVGRQVDLFIVVTRAEFVSQGTRALSGMLAGSNHLTVDVDVLDASKKQNVGKFSVQGEYNPGGFGMFSDPVDSAVADVARAIVDKVLGPPS